MYILGVNTGAHDVSAALLKDGQLICLIEQERLSRRKRAFEESPADAISFCLERVGITLDDVDVVAVGWDMPKLRATFDEPYDDKVFYEWLVPTERFPCKRLPSLQFVAHHLAHAASAFWTSGFDRAAILILDGRGETVATTLATGTPSEIQTLTEWNITQSLGNYYGIAAEWAGLSYWDAGKLMGLAAYGQANQTVPLVPTASGYFFVGSQPVHRRIYRHYMQQCVMLHRHFRRANYPFCPGNKTEIMAYANFASSVQTTLEEVVLHLARLACERTGETKLVIAGGVAMNCTLNGRLARSEMFEDFYIPPIPYDAGVSLGAALVVDHQLRENWVPMPRLEHAYWAPQIPAREVELEIQSSGLHACRLTEADLITRVATHLVAGHTVGWSQGRAEVGQRALGARSILCDPRERSQLVRVNMLKGREVWRPLAPSVLEEYAPDIFGSGLPPAADFMLAAWPVRPDAQRLLPAVVHVDGSARPQVVHRGTNSRFWQLINAFRERTGVPALINTSFNLAGEPIVYRPADVISTFCRSQLDVLALDDFLVEKSNALLFEG